MYNFMKWGAYMKLTFLGADHEVTGSCTLLETNGKKILIDCGMEQGPDTYENCELPVAPSDIDCILLTHAHIDHSGKIPMLYANGCTAPVFATGATVKLCSIMLLDSAHIQEFEAQWRNRKAKRSGLDEYVPMYTITDAQKSLEYFKSCNYNSEYELYDFVKIKFIDAGHLLGSSSIEITVSENGITKSILFSGDIGNIDRPLIKNPQKPEKADYVIMESTYGDRLHGERKDYVMQLTQIFEETFRRGGNVVIPSFAVGRTQELLYIIHQIKKNHLINDYASFDVWVDSPLAIEATKIYGNESEMLDYYDEDTLAKIRNGENILGFEGLKIAVTSEDSKLINDDPTPKVILSASGMCEAGRIRHHLKHNLWRKECTILFVGYQAQGSLGRTIIDGAESVKIFGEEIKINAHIETMDGISGHADKNMLLDWISNLKNKPEKVFINHGNDAVCDSFATAVTLKTGFDATAPYNGAEFDLLANKYLSYGNSVPMDKKQHAAMRANTAFTRLLLAGKRLMSVIEKNKGGANKDLARFTSQIDNLSEKWER